MFHVSTKFSRFIRSFCQFVSAEESKKRWRSLRDAFMKQCKQNANDDMYGNPKKKKWLFYDLMEFLCPYLDAVPDDSYVTSNWCLNLLPFP